MAPKPRANADDSHGTGTSHGKTDTAHGKEKNGNYTTNGTGNNHHPATNGKARRAAAHSNASNAASVAAAATAAAVAAAAAQPQTNGTTNGTEAVVQNPTIQWGEFGRGVLHAYRRTHSLNAQSCYSNEFYRWILCQPGSIGRYSPTMVRRKELRRQSKDQLANTMRKHSNGLGVQENDIIVDFLHKVRSHEISRLHRPRRMGSNAREVDG